MFWPRGYALGTPHDAGGTAMAQWWEGNDATWLARQCARRCAVSGKVQDGEHNFWVCGALEEHEVSTAGADWPWRAHTSRGGTFVGSGYARILANGTPVAADRIVTCTSYAT